jgi:hypothetical protein
MIFLFFYKNNILILRDTNKRSFMEANNGSYALDSARPPPATVYLRRTALRSRRSWAAGRTDTNRAVRCVPVTPASSARWVVHVLDDADELRVSVDLLYWLLSNRTFRKPHRSLSLPLCQHEPEIAPCMVGRVPFRHSSQHDSDGYEISIDAPTSSIATNQIYTKKTTTTIERPLHLLGSRLITPVTPPAIR